MLSSLPTNVARCAVSCALGWTLFGCQNVMWYGYDVDRENSLRILSRCGEQFVEIGGREDPSFDAVAPDSLSVGQGGHVAYAAIEGEAWWVVVDGRAVLRAERILEVSFEREGEALVVVAGDGAAVRVVDLALDHGRWVARHGPEFDAIAKGSRTLSRDGGAAYVGFRGKLGHVVVGGDVGPGFEAIADLQMPSGNQPSYIAHGGEQAWVVRQGELDGPYDDVADLTSNDSGTRLVALVRTDEQWHADDGIERSGPFDGIGDVRVSAVTGRFAFRGTRGEDVFVVWDREELGPFSEVPPGTLRLSGPADTVAFVTRDPTGERVVVDQVTSSTFAKVEELVVDGDGRVGFVARGDFGYEVNVDGAARGAWAWAGDLRLGADGRAVFLSRERGVDVVVNGSRKHAFEQVLRGSLRFAPDSVTWGAMAVVDGELKLVHEHGAGPSVDLEELVGELLRVRSQDAQAAWLDRWMAVELARSSSATLDRVSR